MQLSALNKIDSVRRSPYDDPSGIFMIIHRWCFAATFLFLSNSLLASESPWVYETLEYDTHVPFSKPLQLRAGYYPENPSKPFRGNILFLEGLGDSIANHDPLFSQLSDQGFRVVGFDYPGQGGSSDSMNWTRIVDFTFPRLEIASMAKEVWEKYSRAEDSGKKRQIVLGWSTGGLAAYYMAAAQWADAVILISPGIVVRPIVGDGGTITFPTLTSAVYSENEKDPHVDPIRPSSPLSAPLFAANLFSASTVSSIWEISPKIPGIVFFAGEDSYIFPERSKGIIRFNAPHFKVVAYPKAHHEIDNEKAEIRESFIAEVIEFLKKI